MHLLLLAPLLLAAQQTQQPQGPSQEDLKANFEAKLAKPFVAAGGWITDYDEARALAAKEKKVIFVYFTRSYAK